MDTGRGTGNGGGNGERTGTRILLSSGARQVDEARRPRHTSTSFLAIYIFDSIRTLGQQGRGLKERGIVDRGWAVDATGCRQCLVCTACRLRGDASDEDPAGGQYWGVVLGMRNTLYNIVGAAKNSKGHEQTNSTTRDMDATHEHSHSVHHQNTHNKSCTDNKKRK